MDTTTTISTMTTTTTTTDTTTTTTASSPSPSIFTTPTLDAAIQHRRYPRVATAPDTYLADFAAEHYWHQAYLAWQDQIRIAQEQQWELELQQLRMFGGMPGDEVSLLAPMLKVVTDLFDGYTDYDDP